ncbi:hypothetical protein PR048_017053 [Dryococelus australis]|uniref:Uncharacterized protein n=1 Tax=Dryococelus australis TaxID=614101 RepID=A0ABQ9H913_9NEOP|nr:hypothetical protein PR048_017053 [Dryococelus australis]
MRRQPHTAGNWNRETKQDSFHRAPQATLHYPRVAIKPLRHPSKQLLGWSTLISKHKQWRSRKLEGGGWLKKEGASVACDAAVGVQLKTKISEQHSTSHFAICFVSPDLVCYTSVSIKSSSPAPGCWPRCREATAAILDDVTFPLRTSLLPLRNSRNFPNFSPNSKVKWCREGRGRAQSNGRAWVMCSVRKEGSQHSPALQVAIVLRIVVVVVEAGIARRPVHHLRLPVHHVAHGGGVRTVGAARACVRREHYTSLGSHPCSSPAAAPWPTRGEGSHFAPLAVDTAPLLRAHISLIFKLGTGRDGVAVRLLASHQGELGSIPGGVAPGFSHVGIVPDDTAGRRVFSGISRFPLPHIPALHHTHLISPSSMLRATQISPLHALNLGPRQGRQAVACVRQTTAAKTPAGLGGAAGGRNNTRKRPARWFRNTFPGSGPPRQLAGPSSRTAGAGDTDHEARGLTAPQTASSDHAVSVPSSAPTPLHTQPAWRHSTIMRRGGGGGAVRSSPSWRQRLETRIGSRANDSNLAPECTAAGEGGVPGELTPWESPGAGAAPHARLAAIAGHREMAAHVGLGTPIRHPGAGRSQGGGSCHPASGLYYRLFTGLSRGGGRKVERGHFGCSKRFKGTAQSFSQIARSPRPVENVFLNTSTNAFTRVGERRGKWCKKKKSIVVLCRAHERRVRLWRGKGASVSGKTVFSQFPRVFQRYISITPQLTACPTPLFVVCDCGHTPLTSPPLQTPFFPTTEPIPDPPSTFSDKPVRTDKAFHSNTRILWLRSFVLDQYDPPPSPPPNVSTADPEINFMNKFGVDAGSRGRTKQD